MQQQWWIGEGRLRNSLVKGWTPSSLERALARQPVVGQLSPLGPVVEVSLSKNADDGARLPRDSRRLSNELQVA